MIWKEEDLISLEYQIVNGVIDLQGCYKLECIESLTEISDVFVSEDNNSYKSLDKNLWEYGTAKIFINLAQKFNVRYIKLPKYVNVEKVKFQIRKYPGLMLACRADGFGGRMTALLNAMYLAKKTGFKFGFVWNEINPKYEVCMESECNLFNIEFISKYSYSQSIIAHYTNDFGKKIKDITPSNMKHSYGYNVIFHHPLSKNNFNDLDEQDYKNQLKMLYSKIEYSDRYLKVIEKAHLYAKSLADFTSLHLRNGDVISVFGKFIYEHQLWKRLFPVELAIQASKLIEENVVIFSPDIDEIANVITRHTKNIYILNKEQFYQDLSEFEKTIFDFTLMTHSKTVITPNDFSSTFSHLALTLGDCCSVSLSDFFPNFEEMYKYIISNLPLYDLPSHFKGVSCAYLYKMARQSQQNFDVCEKILLSGIKFDSNNDAHLMEYIQLLFEYKYLDNIEKLLKKNYMREKEILKSYLSIAPGKKISFTKYYNSYFEHSNNPNFPMINYFANQMKDFLKMESKPVSLNAKINSSAISRIHSHLAYKLGSAMILNSKSLWGYMRMPYVLSFIKESHRIEQQKYQESILKNPKLKLPKLESYPDYKEAIKEKECFTYKLGEALIKANNVRGGGRIFAYLRFFKEVRELRREFERKK